MEDKYPYLTYWMVEGLDSFPTIPPIISIYKTLEEMFPKGVPVLFLKKLFSITSNENKPDDSTNILDEVFSGLYYKKIKELQQRYDKGESKKGLLNELGNLIFPNNKGGKIPFLHNKRDLNILHEIYKELQTCIKEIRENLLLPIRNLSLNQVEELTCEDIIESNQSIEKVLKNEELLHTISLTYPNVSDAAMEILCCRLDPFLPKSINPKTIRNSFSRKGNLNKEFDDLLKTLEPKKSPAKISTNK
jgi:hypothetical protein